MRETSEKLFGKRSGGACTARRVNSGTGMRIPALRRIPPRSEGQGEPRQPRTGTSGVLLQPAAQGFVSWPSQAAMGVGWAQNQIKCRRHSGVVCGARLPRCQAHLQGANPPRGASHRAAKHPRQTPPRRHPVLLPPSMELGYGAVCGGTPGSDPATSSSSLGVVWRKAASSSWMLCKTWRTA